MVAEEKGKVRKGEGGSMRGWREEQGDRKRKGGNKGGEAGNGSRRLTRQISCECVHCIGFRWPKITILGKF